LSFTPASGSLALFLNVLQAPGTDYTLATATITFAKAPKATDAGWFSATYTH
jgi:hypothetical protein